MAADTALVPDSAPRGRGVLERLTRVPTWVFVVLALLAWGFAASYIIAFGSKWNLDLRTYRAAGRAVLDGRSLYSVTLTRVKLLWTYPPFGSMVTLPLTFGAVHLVEAYFWLIDAVAACGCVYLGFGLAADLRGRKVLALSAALAGLCVMVLEPVRSNFDFGQINVVLYLLVLVDLAKVRGRGRGVLIGIAAAIKLTPLIFLFYFLAKRDWRALANAVATFVAAGLFAFAVLPHDSAEYWFHKVFDASRTGHLFYVSNQSWEGFLQRFPFHYGSVEKAAWMLLGLATLALGVALTVRLVRGGRTLDAFLALALTGDVIGPVSWTHHWSWVLVLPVAILARPRGDRVVRALLGVLLLETIVAPYWWHAKGSWRVLPNNSLVFVGAIVLIGWTLTAYRGSPTVGSHGPDQTAPRERSELEVGAHAGLRSSVPLAGPGRSME
jgi:alpha-1,2-mannosyltransferase